MQGRTGCAFTQPILHVTTDVLLEESFKAILLALLFLNSPNPYHSTVFYSKFCFNIICITAVTILSNLTYTQRSNPCLGDLTD